MHYVEQKKSNTYLEYRIGKMYQYGLGTDENMEQAGEWFSKAAAKEHKYALYSLGMLYLQGKGVEQDEETAYSLLFRSYSKGNPYAAYELGNCMRQDAEQRKSGKVGKLLSCSLSRFSES